MGSPRLPLQEPSGPAPPKKNTSPRPPSWPSLAAAGPPWNRPRPPKCAPGKRQRREPEPERPAVAARLAAKGCAERGDPRLSGAADRIAPSLLKTPPARLWSWIWAPVPRVQVAGGVSRASGGEGRWAGGAAMVPARFWGGGQRLKSRQGEGSPPPCRCCQPSSGRGRSILCSRAPPSAAIPAHHAGSKREEPKGC